MSELPNGWAEARLSEVCSVLSGYGFPERLQGRNEGDLPFYKVRDISEAWKRGEVLLDTAENYLNFPEAQEIRAHPFPAGTTVLAKIGAAIGLNRRVMLTVPSLVDNNVMGLVPRSACLNSKYLYFFSCTLRLMDYAQATTVPSVRKTDIEEILIPVAPHEEQDRIVAEIEKQFTRLDAATAALKRVQANLKRYRASVLKTACEGRLVPMESELARKEGRDYEPADKLLQRILCERRVRWEADTLAKMQASGKPPKDDHWKQKYKEPSAPDTSMLPELPEGWCWATWDQLSNWVTYGFTRPVPHLTEGIPIVTARHIFDGKINFEECHLASEEMFRSLSDKDRPARDDILITKDGTIGRAGVVESDVKFCINQSVAVIRLRSCSCDRRYLLAVIEAPLTQRPIEEKARGVAIKHLSITDFAKMPVPLAPYNEQTRIGQAIASQTSTIGRTQVAVSAHLKAANGLRNSISTAAFSGHLVPQDPADESASVLLERICAERSAPGVQKSTRRIRKEPTHA